MGKLFNFNNIGGKIKGLAKWVCWVSIILIWIAAPVMLVKLVSNSYTAKMWWQPVVMAVVGPVLIWIASWILYAFGEFVEDIHAIRTGEKSASATKSTPHTPKQTHATVPAATKLLTAKDIESAVSMYLKQNVSLADISCTLVYVIPARTRKPQEMHLSLVVGNDMFSSLDLVFFDHKKAGYYLDGQRLALDETWLPANSIFNFNVELFKSFTIAEDNTD